MQINGNQISFFLASSTNFVVAVPNIQFKEHLYICGIDLVDFRLSQKLNVLNKVKINI